MEGRQRRSFTDDYKRQAVDLVKSSGRSVGLVAEELGLRDSVLRRWVKQMGARLEPTAAAPTTQATLPSADQAAEIARLQRENERLRMERDILKNCHGLLSRTVVRLRAVETVRANLAAWRVAAVSLLEAQSPLKNVVHGWMRT